MREDQAPSYEDASYPDALRALVAEFRAQWQAGQQPGLSIFLERGGEDRSAAFRALLRAELEARLAAGFTPTSEEYAQRFPEMLAEVAAAFAVQGDAPPSSDIHTRTRESGPPDSADMHFTVNASQSAETVDSRAGVTAQDRWPATAGRYEIRHEIARGGMGGILRGYDPEFRRPVALKVLLGQAAESDTAVRRFLNEARITAQLQHPGLPPIYDLGVLPDHRPFFAMKLIEGETLTQLLTRRTSPRDDLSRFLSIFEKICQAVAYAHSQGIIHRDLKPQNVMVGEFGDVQVMDWGLAKRLTSSQVIDDEALDYAASLRGEVPPAEDFASPGETDLSRTGMVLGTPSYMPPEQAGGKLRLVDQRADVFGLSAILCVILTGHPPYIGGSRREAFERSHAGDLTETFARLDACEAPPQLIALAKQGLQADPALRPADASYLADKVRSYQESVESRLRETQLERVAAETRSVEQRKRRRVLGLLALATLVVIGMVVVGLVRASQDQARFESESASTLTEAAYRLEEAESLGEEPDRMNEMLDVVQSHLDALRDRQQATARDLGPANQQQLDRLVQATLALRRDNSILQTFNTLRRAAGEVDHAEGRYLDAEAVDKLWPEVIRYGLDPGKQNARQAAEFIQSRPPVITRQLTDLLQYLLMKSPLAAQTDNAPWLQAALDALDPQPTRVATRGAIVKSDLPALTKIASELNVREHSPEYLFALGRQLPSGAEGRLAYLHRAQFAHPDDFWLNHLLGIEAQDIARRQYQGTSVSPALMEALAALRAAAALEPKNPGNYVNLGIAYSAANMQDDAIASLKRAIEIAPKYGAAHVQLGMTYVKLQQYDLAGPELQAGVELSPGFATGHTQYAMWLAGKQRYDEANAQFELALQLKPDDPQTLFEFGRAKGAQNKFPEAMQLWRRAAELAPWESAPHFYLGLSLIDAGQFDEAVTELTTVTRMSPSDALAFEYLSMAYERKGEPLAAATATERQVAISGQKLETSIRLGNLNYQAGQLPAAITHWQRAKFQGELPANTFTYLAYALEQLGRREEALAACHECAEHFPEFSANYFTYAQILTEAGRFDEALAALNKCAELADPQGPPAETIDSQKFLSEESRQLKEKVDALTLDDELPTSADALLQWAEIANGWCGKPRLAMHIYQRRFKDEIQATTPVGPGEKFHAACAAVQAGVTLHFDPLVAGTNNADRGACRDLALAWLREQLAAWREAWPNASTAERGAMSGELINWLTSVRLQAVRDDVQLQRLAKEEREPWQTFWNDVQTWNAEVAAALAK